MNKTQSWHQRQPTDEDEGQANEEGQDVSSQRFVVLSVALCKHAQARIDVVFAQGLGRKKLESFAQFIWTRLVKIQPIHILDYQAFQIL